MVVKMGILASLLLIIIIVVRCRMNSITLLKLIRYILFQSVYFFFFQDHKQPLTDEDITVVKRAMETKGIIDVPIDVIRRQWKLIYKRHFLEKIVQVYIDSIFFNCKCLE